MYVILCNYVHVYMYVLHVCMYVCVFKNYEYMTVQYVYMLYVRGGASISYRAFTREKQLRLLFSLSGIFG